MRMLREFSYNKVVAVSTNDDLIITCEYSGIKYSFGTLPFDALFYSNEKRKLLMYFSIIGWRVFLSALALGSLFLTLGCETPVAMQKLPKLTFVHLQPFSVNVASIEIVNQFSSKMKAPHIEHRLPTSPTTALIQWAKDRLKATGKFGKLRIFIEDASATEIRLDLDKSLKGQFTKQQSHLYKFSLRVTALLTDASGTLLGSAKATATRSATLREDISLNERQRAWFDLMDRLINDFDRQMEANLKQHLGSWLH